MQIPKYTYIFSTVLIVFLVYVSSILRPWLPFDERLFFSEDFLPMPLSLKEVFETIHHFIPNAHLISANPFFSDNITLRSDPIAWSLLTFIFFLFKKNAIVYHCFQLFIHLINTALVWFMLHRSIQACTNKTTSNHHLIVSLFTLCWGLHSTNTEAIMLSTNWNALLLYSFCFGFILYEISNITKSSFNKSLKQTFTISILFFFCMLIAEFAYTLPLIVFVLFATFTTIKSNKKPFLTSLKASFPYFLGLAFFIVFQLIKPDSLLSNLVTTNALSPVEFIERNLWLTPQVFIHFLKLLFFPLTLSIYQSNLIYLSKNLFSTYSIFCTLTYSLFLFLPLILFLLLKKRSHAYLCLITYAFYFALFPFLHIVTPSYCLIADRYCYFPGALLALVLLLIFHQFYTNLKLKSLFIISASVIVLSLGIRTVIRIEDWKSQDRFLESAINAEKDPLYKAHKLIVYAKNQQDNSLKKKLIAQSLNLLNNKLKHLSNSSTTEPLTLKSYGLDSDSLRLKTAYLIATIKNDFLGESPKQVLLFYEPYIKETTNPSINPISLYAALLSKDGQLKYAKTVLEEALKRFPYSLELMLSLSNFYTHDNDTNSLIKILTKAYSLFPNEPRVLSHLFNYYKLKGDLHNQAQFAYLIGLRNHSISAYQEAAKTYLDLKELKNAKQALEKLSLLKNNSQITLSLKNRYLELTGKLLM